jgi:dolichol-phosphate mannosyltransferase
MNSAAPLLSIIIPILNEGKTIRTIVERVQNVSVDKEIIIVNDGSTDDTAVAIAGLGGGNITAIHHQTNMGKGAAIRSAIPHVRGQYTIIQDGDLEYDPQDFLKLLKAIQEKDADVVYGSRIMSHSRMSYLRYWLGGRGVTFFTNLLFGSGLTDEPTCYKMFRSELLKSLPLISTGFEFCPEVTGMILKRRIPIFEVPISYDPRTIEQGKKIRWRDGLIALWVLLKIRFSGSK